MLKKAFVVLGLVALMAGLIGGSAGAAGKKRQVNSRISVQFDPLVANFTGTVKSSPRCQKIRTVRIIEVEGGLPDGSDRPTTVGTDRTNKDGKYEVRISSAPDVVTEYRARVETKRTRRLVCQRAQSEKVTYIPMEL